MINWEIIKSPRSILVIAALSILALVVARKIIKHPATNGEAA